MLQMGSLHDSAAPGVFEAFERAAEQRGRSGISRAGDECVNRRPHALSQIERKPKIATLKRLPKLRDQGLQRLLLHRQ
jgi:hypothetical protein